LPWSSEELSDWTSYYSPIEEISHGIRFTCLPFKVTQLLAVLEDARWWNFV
jgi:hypothetical protein